MSTDSQIKAVEQKILGLIETDPDTFLVEVKIQPGNHIKIFLDADRGLSIDKLGHYNRILYKQIEATGLFPNGDFSLEVSSPGLDEPLKLHRQYLKNMGRDVEVLLRNGIKKEGKLVNVSDSSITIEEEKGTKKHKELVQSPILYNDIKATRIQIKF